MNQELYIDARSYLADLAKDGIDQYIDRIWAMRYPLPSPKSSAGWPCKSAEVKPLSAKVHQLRKKHDTPRV